jgi:cysteine desulfurase
MSTSGRTSHFALAGGAIALAFTAVGLTYIYMKHEGTLDQEVNVTTSSSPPNKKGLRLGSTHPAMTLAQYKSCIYMDYNATTPIFPEVSEVMLPFMSTCFGNPSSSHVFSLPCKEAIKKARSHVQKLVNSESPEELIFTSCGSESDNRAVDIAINSYYNFYSAEKGNVKMPHIVTSNIEHVAILSYLQLLEKKGSIELTTLAVDDEGSIDPKQVFDALQSNTALVTIMHSNNEVGTIQPIREICDVIRRYNNKKEDYDSNVAFSVLFHTDAAQSLGKVAIDVQFLGVDMLTIVGHKFGAPKGIAALYIKSSTHVVHPLLVGGGQEGGRRAGTENVLLISALGEAARIARLESTNTLIYFLKLKQRLITNIRAGLTSSEKENVRFNGPVRSNDVKEIASDLSVLEMMMQPNLGSNLRRSRQQDNKNFIDDMFKEFDTGIVPLTKENQVISVFGSTDNEKRRSRKESIAMGNGEDVAEEVIVLDDEEGDEEDHMRFMSTASTLVAQLPNTVSVSFKGIRVKDLMPLLLSKVACSAGSACHESKGDALSPVLEALRVPIEFGRGTLRLSFGRHTTVKDIDETARHVTQQVNALREVQARSK